MNNDGPQQGGPPPGDQPNVPSGGYPPASAPQPPGYETQPTQYGPPQGYAPPPGGPYPVTPAPPSERKRSPILTILLVVLGVLIICGFGSALAFGALFGGVFAVTQPVVDAGDAYMRALRDGDYDTAFELSAPSLQQEAGNAAGIAAALSSKQPSTWSFNSRNINNNDGNVSGTTTYKDGTTGTVEISLTKIGNDWKVVGISLE